MIVQTMPRFLGTWKIIRVVVVFVILIVGFIVLLES